MSFIINYANQWKSAFQDPKAIAISVILSALIAPIITVCFEKGIDYITKKRN